MAKATPKKPSGKGKPAPAKAAKPAAKKPAPAAKKKPVVAAKKAAPAAKKPSAPAKKPAAAPAKKAAPAPVKKAMPATKMPLKAKETTKPATAPVAPSKPMKAAPMAAEPIKVKAPAAAAVQAEQRGAATAASSGKSNRPIVVPEHFKKLAQQLEGLNEKSSSVAPTERHQIAQNELFSDEELAKFLVSLQDERNKLLDKARAAVDAGNIALDKDEMYDEVDLASATVDQNLTFRLLDRDRKLLGEIDHAITKIHSGEFGFCEGTGEPIPKRRLELRPWCKYSVKYKEQLEKMKKSGRGVVDEDEDMFA